MRAAVISELEAPPGLAERPDPTGAVYEVTAVPLNPIDVNVGAGRYFGGHPELPYVPGCEGVGRSGDGRAYLFSDGLGLSRDGTLAERVEARNAYTIAIPDDVSDEIAAACGIAGMAGWAPLAWRAPVRPDDRVLVLGATGTVGLVAVQGAKVLGAQRVVAAGRNRDRLARAAELGADATVQLDAETDLVAAFKEVCGGDGPTYIVDPLWGAPAVAAIQAAARGWRLVQIGQSAGGEVPLASAAIRGKMGEVYGFTDFAVPPEVFVDTYLRLVRHAAAGEIVFDLETYPFERVAEAWERQVSGAHAKIVVTLS
jgi:NADPH:quinone reductase